MITLKGAEVSAKIKEQVLAMNGKLGGYVPTAAIVRIGERPDDLSYERNVMKRIAAYGMETKLCVSGGYHRGGVLCGVPEDQ